MPPGEELTEKISAAIGGDRPRADAQRNVERLVGAARDAVDELGLDVSSHEIARRARVGVGTFYRRIPSRTALLEAILVELMSEGSAQADDAIAGSDAWLGFVAFAHAYVELRVASRGVCEALDGRGGPALEEARNRLMMSFHLIVKHVQRRGAIRGDVAWQDIPFLLAGAVPPHLQAGLKASEAQWKRNLQIILDGLRTPQPSVLPGMPPQAQHRD